MDGGGRGQLDGEGVRSGESCLVDRMDGCADARIFGWTDGRMGGWTDIRMGGRASRLGSARAHGWEEGWGPTRI